MDADVKVNDEIASAYRTKYRNYGAQYAHMIGLDGYEVTTRIRSRVWHHRADRDDWLWAERIPR